MKKENLVLLVIVFVSFIIRIYNDPTSPFHYDPGKNIVYARAVLNSFPFIPQYNPYFNLGEYYEYQVLFPYIVAFFYKLTGFSFVNITKWSIIIIGSLMTITVYLLSKEIFNNITGLISASLISIDKVQLLSYLNYYPQILGLTILPIPLIFIIRYLKTFDNKYIVYVSISSTAIILSSYLAGIVYLSILIISILIYAIMENNLKIINTLISIIVGILGLMTFYILPIIQRYGIKSFINGIIDSIFTIKNNPFTNVPLDIWINKFLMTLVFIFLIVYCSYLIIYLYIRKSSINFRKIKYGHILLFVWFSISLILVLSYKFRPVLWTDRYLEFLDMSAIILAGYSIYYIINYFQKKKIQFFLLILIFIIPTIDLIRHDYQFGYWNTPNDIDALNYVNEHIPSESLFVTPSGITSFWISALGGVHVLGGESSQILGEKFDGNSISDIIIRSPNVDEKMNLIRKYGVQYIYLTIRKPKFLLWNYDYSLEGLKAFNDPRYFEGVYSNSDDISAVFILKVKENLIPSYKKPNIDENITVFGYIISMMTFIIMMIFIYTRNK